LNGLKILLTAGLSLAAGLLLLSCSNSTSDWDVHEFPPPINASATDITLTIFPLEISAFPINLPVDTEGAVEISFGMDVHYEIYARADGYYTEIYGCADGDTITVDLDSIPSVDRAVTGVIIAGRPDLDGYLANHQVTLTDPNGRTYSTTTDSQGRFGVSLLPTGTQAVSFECGGMPFSYEVSSESGTVYRELYFTEPILDRAPYLYLYPEEEMTVSVKLSFPHNGAVVTSEPPYGDGWNVHVTPEGLIDKEHAFLYYEAALPLPVSLDRGWLLDGNALDTEFRGLLSGLGFAGREIDDFIDYWLPKLPHSPWYGVYPQRVDEWVELDIEPPPDYTLRSLLYIRPLASEVSIPAPEMPAAFTRDGFVVVEWGVILTDQ